MDKELDTYVEEIMDKQVYRNGIFSSWVDKVIQAVVDFRAAPDTRGMYGIRGGN
jgi:hypothetical protein|tara:strand:- start:155 stop:316 length:162 start_codon:yes stop_codon:yes gene_type:complete